MRLLLVEDDDPLREWLKGALQQAGYAVDAVADGVEAERMGRYVDYDAVVLDLGLPGRDGLGVLRAWRSTGRHLPVLILTARDSWHERVEGFRAGADDYLGKPFNVEELVLRLAALLRRSAPVPVRAREATGGMRLDEARQAVELTDGREVELTGTEFRLLRVFMRNAGRLLSKAQLSDHLYELSADRDSNVIEVYVNRLRHKLGHEVIETRRGQGYVFRGGG